MGKIIKKTIPIILILILLAVLIGFLVMNPAETTVQIESDEIYEEDEETVHFLTISAQHLENDSEYVLSAVLCKDGTPLLENGEEVRTDVLINTAGMEFSIPYIPFLSSSGVFVKTTAELIPGNDMKELMAQSTECRIEAFIEKVS